ncbi:hypothetical protein BKA70DRAFT_1229192 [Coprinopsis sp. MPI-PUGE-AT-0042]|nr:hypothetical protein BKA70DRAFT_1229192 [Coprinopsis sp. MPI-PUGE-AT-0042]
MQTVLEPEVPWASASATPRRLDQVTIHQVIEDGAVYLYFFLFTVSLHLTVHTLIRFKLLAVEQKERRRRYVLLLLVLFALSASRFTLYLREGIPRFTDSPGVWIFLDDISVTSGPDRIESKAEYVVSFGCTAAMSLLGDAFLVWRATVIWNHHRVLRWVPCLAFLVYCAICVTSLSIKASALEGDIVSKPGVRSYKELYKAWFQDPQSFNENEIRRINQAIVRVRAVFRTWRTIDFSMSVGVNILTTGMITVRLLLMERNMNRISAHSATFRAGLPYKQIITWLLESALPFTIISVVAAVLSGVNDPTDESGTRKAVHAFPIMMVLWTNALINNTQCMHQALGPQIIIFRIISGTTWTSNPAPNASRPISQPILFADDPVVSLLASEYADEEHELDAHDPAPPASLVHNDLEGAVEQPTGSPSAVPSPDQGDSVRKPEGDDNLLTFRPCNM